MKKKINSLIEKFILGMFFTILMAIPLYSLGSFGLGIYDIFTAKETEVVEIISLRNDEEVEGRGYRYVRIDTQEYVHYWTQTGDELTSHKVEMNVCKIYEDIQDNKKPYIKLTIRVLGNIVESAELHVPKGTVIRQMELE